jgi:hypothetical protein
MQIKYSMPSRLALRVVCCGVLCVSLLCNPWVFASSDLPPIVKLPIWLGSKDQTDFASWALKSPATESWQNWCDDGHDEFAEYDMYSFCSSYSPKLVLEDEFSQKVLRNVKAGTLNMLRLTQFIRLLRWTGVEGRLMSSNDGILSGLSVEMQPGLDDTYLHLRYYFE